MKRLNLILISLTITLNLISANVKNLIDSAYNCRVNDRFESAIKYSIEAFKVAKTDSQRIWINDNLGMVYSSLKKYDKALECYNAALELCKTNPYKLVEGDIYINKGAVYGYRKQTTESYQNFQQAALIAREIKDSLGLAVITESLGILDKDKKDYKEAFKKYEEVLRIYERLKEQSFIPNILYNLADVSEKLGNVTAAIEYQKQGLNLAKQLELKNDIIKASQALSEYYAKINDYKNAYSIHLYSIVLKDSLFSIESNKQIEEMATKYQTEKKQQAIESLEKDKVIQKTILEKKNVYLYIVIGGIIILLLIAGLIYYKYKDSRTKNKIIEAAKQTIEHKNKEITDSIMYAKKIQETILPKIETIKESFKESFVYYQPKDIVSGDFYWTNGTNLLAVADCTGHGVPGSLVSMINSELLNMAVKETNDVAEILTKTNIALQKKMKSFGRQDGMDIALISLNYETLKLEYAGANRSLYIVRQGSIIELSPNKASIGGSTATDFEFKKQTIQLEKGDSIFMTTDGFGDQFGGERDKKFTTKRMKELFTQIANEPIEKQLCDASDAIINWKGLGEQTDDMLVIGVKI